MTKYQQWMLRNFNKKNQWSAGGNIRWVGRRRPDCEEDETRPIHIAVLFQGI